MAKDWDDLEVPELSRTPPGQEPAAARKAEAPAEEPVGGAERARGAATEAKPLAVSLRIPGDVAARVDRAVLSRPVKIPRHTWLLEAVVEKLDREEEDEASG